MRCCRTGGGQQRLRFRLLLLVFLLLSLHLFSFSTFAAVWPSAELTAQAGVVLDVDTGTVLFEKNGTERLYPASITKVMTALVVLEHAKLGEKVTFSHDAVYNVDSGSSNAQIDEGDVLTVEDCLYALLLKSANEAANALAEHVAGSRAAFAELMNEKAAELGCTGTHFANPSGLWEEEHYTTAEDMARIGRAAFQNEDFLRIEESRSHRIAPSKRVPEGLMIYMEHKMLLPNSVYYDERVVAGKTGYTLASGNTLLTLAKSGGRRLAAVVLGDKNPAHYTDTRTLLDLGFNQTEKRTLPDSFYNMEMLRNRLVQDTVSEDSLKSSELELKGSRLVSVPLGTEETELHYRLNYNVPENAPQRAVAEIEYLLGDRQVGSDFIVKAQSIRILIEDAPAGTKAAAAAVTLSGFTVLGIVLFALFGGGAAAWARRLHGERQRRKELRENRLRRLRELDMSEEEFRELVEKRRKKRG